MPLINLGSMTNIAGKNVTSGLASGMDTKTLVESQLEVKKKPITDKEDKVTLNNHKVEAYKEMKYLMKDLQTKAKALHNPPSPLDAAENIFNYRKVTGTTNEEENWDKYVKVSAEAGATIAEYKLNIKQLAVAKSEQIGASGVTIGTQTGFTSKTTSITKTMPAAGEFKAGTFQINGKDITLEVGDTLTNVKEKINYLTTQTNVRAEIIQVSSTDYRLVLASTLTGTGAGYEYTITDASSLLGNVGTAPATIAQDAEFNFNGMDLTRKSNVVSDVIDKVKMTLLTANTDADPANKNITFSFAKDKDEIKKSILNLVMSYNDFMQFVAKQQERDPTDYSFKETAYLGRDPMFKRSVSLLKDSLSYNVIGMDTTKLNNLALIGLAFYKLPANPADDIIEAPDSLELASETLLDKALDDKLEEVQQLFEFTFNAPQNKIVPRERASLLDTTEFTVKIKSDGLGGVYTADEKVAIEYENSSGVTVIEYADFTETGTGSGNLAGIIKGREDTIIAGFNMTYFGNTTLAIDTIDVTFTQGFADKAFLSLNSYITYDGLIDNEIKSLTDATTRYKQDIEKLNLSLDKHRDYLLMQYSKVEQNIAAANKSMMFMDAYNNANNRD
ncbi:MAG: hypothetical protein K0R02_67 [Rickettsiaceae bacterium]|nr:hypothetical protein [Rickettsiaceae bacterium]